MAGTGGKRAGAGRPKTKLSRTVEPLKKATAEEILASIDETAFWQDLLWATTVVSVKVLGEDSYQEITIPDRKIRIDAGKYLTNRRDGMPKQAIENEHSGSILMQHSIPRPARE